MPQGTRTGYNVGAKGALGEPEAQSRSRYHGVFDYKFAKYPERHYRALLLWIGS